MGSFNGRNNCIFYYSPIHTLGGKNEIQTAISVLQGFNLVVVGVHTGGDLVILNRVIHGAKAVNSNQKWYGYVSFGSVGSGVAAASADQWMTDCPPSSGLIDGIFLDEFGHDFASGDRTQQNGIVDYCHDVLNDGSTTGVPVFVNPWVPTDLYAQPPGTANTAAGTVGGHATHVDSVLVESFLYGVDSNNPAATGDWVRDKGRVEYYINQRDNNSKKLRVCAMIGAGEGTGSSPTDGIPDSDYRAAVRYLEALNADFVCVNHGDLGGTSQTFFIQNTKNIFPSAIPSGGPAALKF